MPNKEIKTETFTNRAYACGYYKEGNNYAKYIRLLFKDVIKNYQDSSYSDISNNITDSFNRHYTSRIFDGPKRIYVKDKVDFNKFCINAITNFSNFIEHNNIQDIFLNYKYKKLVGMIGCIVNINNKNYTVDFSFYNKIITYYKLYYHKFNCHLYNEVHGFNHDTLIFVVPENLFYLIKYNKNNYTISNSYIEANRCFKAYNPGHQCASCDTKNCKPRLLNDLWRL